MKKINLLVFSFLMAFITTAVLCVINGYPLIFDPVDYGTDGFLRLGSLILFLSICLVYINLSSLKWLKKVFKLNINPTVYYVATTLFVLQIFTMATGYIESLLFTRLAEADILYYYKCVSNSCLYIFSGNLTSIVIAYLFGKEESKITIANNVYSR